MFRIPKDKFSPSNWQSVATILKQGVEMNTLPCAKLRAIVEAAREISRVYEEEQEGRHWQQQQLQLDHNYREENRLADSDNEGESSHRPPSQEPATAAASDNGSTKEHLGADDFLPIFIFCVVQAQMERPCALCK